jgi:hypothetical protein
MFGLRRCEGGLVAVTTEARCLPCGDEVVRLVAAFARRVTGRQRSLRLLMTARAGGRGVTSSGVRLVAIGARLATRVRRRPFLVARRAVRHDGGLVRLMARRTRDRRVMRNRRVPLLRLRVAVDAPRRLARRRKAVTGEAARRVAKLAAVPPVHLFRMAMCASRGTGIFETFVREIVAATAFDVGRVDVGHVPGAQTNLCPGGRNVRRNGRDPSWPPRHEGRDDQNDEHAGGQTRPDLPPPGHGPTP